MSIIKKFNNEEKIIANKSLIDHNQLANREQYGAHPISAIRKLPEKLTSLKNKDNDLESSINQLETNLSEEIENRQNADTNIEGKAERIQLINNGDNSATFTNYNNESTTIPLGRDADELTITYTNDNKFQAVALKDGDTILNATQIKDRFDAVESDVDGLTENIRVIQATDIRQDGQILDVYNRVKGLGGYLNAVNFGTATPTEEQLNQYAIEQIPNITQPSEIFNQTKVTNLFNNHVWILTNTLDSEPPVLSWADDGPQNTISIATDDFAGLVKGSNDDYRGSIDTNGYISINNLEEKLDEIDTTSENRIGDIIKLDFNATKSGTTVTGYPTTTININDLIPGNIYMIDISLRITGSIFPDDVVDVETTDGININNGDVRNPVTINFKAPNNVTGFATIGDLSQTHFPYDQETGHRWIFNALFIKNTNNGVDSYFFGIIPSVVVQDLIRADAELLVEFETGIITPFYYNDGQLFLCTTGNNAAYKEGHIYEAQYDYRSNTVTFLDRSHFEYKTAVFTVSGEAPQITTVGEIGSRAYNSADNIWWTCKRIDNPLIGNDSFTYIWEQDMFNQSFPASFITHETIEDFCQSVITSPVAIPGTSFFGGLNCSGLPNSLANGECQVNVIGSTLGGKVLSLEIYSANTPPYKWYSIYWTTWNGWTPAYQIPDVISTYIIDGTTPLANNWLSTTAGGVTLTPEINKIYIIKTPGDYYNLQFIYNIESAQYEQTGGGQIDVDNTTINENINGELQAIGLTDGTDITTAGEIRGAISIDRAGVKSLSTGKVQYTMAQFEALATVDTNTEYDLTDHPSDSITNTQMVFALTCTRLFPAGATYICQDNGTYSAAHIYQIVVNGGVKSWLDMTNTLGYAIRTFL